MDFSGHFLIAKAFCLIKGDHTISKTMHNEGSLTNYRPPVNKMTRRQVLRTTVYSSIVLGSMTAGGAVLTACGSDSASAPVTLLLSDGPIKGSVITSKNKLTDPDDIAEQQILQDWLKQNKNVTFKTTAIDTSTDQALQAAIAARTAPQITRTFTSMALNRTASKRKFAADVTDLYKKYDLDNKLADYAKPLFQQGYNLGGKYYALPGDAVTAGAGLYYRRDLLQEKGIADPQLGWNWDDFYALLRQFQTNGQPVMGAPSWMIGWSLNANLLDPLTNSGVLGAVPAPKDPWHWKINIDPWLDEWKKVTEAYRKAALDDNLIEQNATAYPWEGPAMGKFASGQYPFSPGYAFQGTISGYAPITPIEMPSKFNKTFDELVGFVAYPKGANGGYNINVMPSISGQTMFPYYLKGNALEKAVDLYVYRFYGDGYINKYAKKYDLTKDPKAAYKFVAPANRYQKNPKVPVDVTVENAFGTKWVKSYMDPIRKLLPMPSLALYFPPDTQTGPTDTAHSDALTKLSQSKDDVAGILKTFQDTYNQQASSLTSDVSTQDFISAAKSYFSTLDKYFKEHEPEFYAGDWKKYYHNYALPALS